MKKLAIICTHPIQYYAPLFKLLSSSNQIELKVFYTWGEDSLKKHDPGFNKIIEWDIPTLEGYKYTLVKNTARSPGSSNFFGIINPTLIDEIKEFNPNTILVYGWAYNSHLKVICYFKNKVTLCFRGDSTLLTDSKSWKRIARSLFLKWVYKHIDIAFYVGTENKKYYESFGLTENQLCFAPHAIDNKRFNEAKNVEGISIREELNIKKENKIILFAGKLEPIKNPELLLNAFLECGMDNAHLIFVGNGILETKLKQIANNRSNVHFVGFQNQSVIPIYYHECDLFCLPSLSETWGLAVNEAMACGKAILVSDKVGCATDLVKPDLNGDIFESNSIESLKVKIFTLLKDSEKLQLFGRASKKIIEEWSFERSCEEILKRI